MSAARRAAEAAFADPVSDDDRHTPPPSVVDVRVWRTGLVDAGAPIHADQALAALRTEGRAPRVFRVKPVESLRVVKDESDGGAERDPAAPRLRARRTPVAPVRFLPIVNGPAVASASASDGRSGRQAGADRWARLWTALSRLDATFAEIRAAQGFRLPEQQMGLPRESVSDLSVR